MGEGTNGEGAGNGCTHAAWAAHTFTHIGRPLAGVLTDRSEP